MDTHDDDATLGEIRLTAEQLAEIELACQEVREGKFATDAEMQEVWRLFGC